MRNNHNSMRSISYCSWEVDSTSFIEAIFKKSTTKHHIVVLFQWLPGRPIAMLCWRVTNRLLRTAGSGQESAGISPIAKVQMVAVHHHALRLSAYVYGRLVCYVHRMIWTDMRESHIMAERNMECFSEILNDANPEKSHQSPSIWRPLKIRSKELIAYRVEFGRSSLEDRQVGENYAYMLFFDISLCIVFMGSISTHPRMRPVGIGTWN